jgi:hypothetical protein
VEACLVGKCGDPLGYIAAWKMMAGMPSCWQSWYAHGYNARSECVAPGEVRRELPEMVRGVKRSGKAVLHALNGVMM